MGERMTDTSEGTTGTTSSAIRLALAWMVVLLPAAWGVYNTVLRAARLFQ